MPCEELDIVWNNIKAEARALADCEPMLASFYHATLLKHENLGSALSYMLANKLASSIMLLGQPGKNGRNQIHTLTALLHGRLQQVEETAHAGLLGTIQSALRVSLRSSPCHSLCKSGPANVVV
jgi:Serine acetyltransferase, N-terminal.